MACETESKAIGDHEYTVTQWPAETAILMKFRLVKLFGASLAKLIEHPKQDDNGANLSGFVSELFANASPEDMLATLKQCVVGVTCDEKRITNSTFTELFSGNNLPDVYKVFVFVLQVNFSNLFSGQKMEEVMAKLKKNL